MNQKLKTFLVIVVMVGGVLMPVLPFDVEGATADPEEPIDDGDDGACFLSGTHVAMVDGSEKSIQLVNPGDMVQSYDDGSMVSAEVSAVFEHSSASIDEYLKINDRLRVTPDHIMYVNGDWQPARNVSIGDELLGVDGGAVVVWQLARVEEQAPTYNLEVDGYHVFFADGVLVHNAKQNDSDMADPITNPSTNSPPNTPDAPSGCTETTADPACLLPGTQVVMADGSKKSIQLVEVGDRVVSCDGGSVVNGTVTEVLEHSSAEMPDHYVIINNRLRVTPNHFMYVNGGWMPASEVMVGDELLSLNGTAIPVTEVEAVYERAPTYNLEIESCHTFYADDVLVHNFAKVGYMYTASATDPDGDDVYYKFSWGNGEYSGWLGPFSSGATRGTSYVWSTSGTYDVTVRAKDEHGELSGWSPALTVHVNEAPVADFTYTAAAMDTDSYIYFSDCSSDDGTIVSRNWDFGDGHYGSGISPTHKYDSAGTYTVTLTIEDDDGASASKSETLSITGAMYVAIYNVSHLEPAGTSEIWKNTVTCGMKLALEECGEWDYNGDTYKFKPAIVDWGDIVDDGKRILSQTLGNGEPKYKLFIAPGNDNYWFDQAVHFPNHNVYRDEVTSFVANGGGYIGTCGGGTMACTEMKYYYSQDGTTTIDSYNTTFLLEMVDATAFTEPWYKGNSRYVRKTQLYDEGQFDGTGISDWGGIPLEHKFNDNLPASLSAYNGEIITLRYWGGRWYENPGNGVTPIAKYYREPSPDEPTTDLHDKIDGVVWNVTTHLEDEYASLQAPYGNGNVLIFGAHPELKTWQWGSGEIIEGEKYKNYSYCCDVNNDGIFDEEDEPPVNTRYLIGESAMWMVEQQL